MKRRPLWILSFVTIALVLANTHSACARKWTDSSGSFSIEADLVRIEKTTVHLKKTNGEVIQVPLAKLSREKHCI